MRAPGYRRSGRARRGCTGTTLVELIVAITIVALAVSSVLGALAAISSRSADSMVQQQAVAIAQAYLDEILQRWVVDPNGTPPNTGRASWDTVDQYNGLANTGAQDQFGNSIAALGGYSVNVTVGPSTGLGSLSSAVVRRIDVTVTHTPDVSVVLTGYRVAY